MKKPYWQKTLVSDFSEKVAMHSVQTESFSSGFFYEDFYIKKIRLFLHNFCFALASGLNFGVDRPKSLTVTWQRRPSGIH
jgi:hypothetical protein